MAVAALRMEALCMWATWATWAIERAEDFPRKVRVRTGKAQYPAAIGAALSEAAMTPAALHAYETLHELAELRPHRTVRFHGFSDGEVRAVARRSSSNNLGTRKPPERLPRADLEKHHLHGVDQYREVEK